VGAGEVAQYVLLVVRVLRKKIIQPLYLGASEYELVCFPDIIPVLVRRKIIGMPGMGRIYMMIVGYAMHTVTQGLVGFMDVCCGPMPVGDTFPCMCMRVEIAFDPVRTID